MLRKLTLYFCGVIALSASAVPDFPGDKLSGTPIGSTPSVDYNNGFIPSTTVNLPADVFDGDLSTFYASYDRSFTWVGLELDRPYIITGLGFAPRNETIGAQRLCLGVFQGANNPDFSDAMPIYLIPESAPLGEMTYASVDCSMGFKYVRYVGPRDARCNIAEIEFYGLPGEGDDSRLYQVTNLPLVVVNTPGMEWFHEDDKSYEMNGSSITVIADNQIDVSASGQIRGRGNASWGFPKKPFRIKFDKKQKVLGGPAKAKKWTMINNYGDKTLMRNRLAFDISQRLGLAFTPACHFVDLIFNGEYQGCYQLCDQVEVNPGRVEITEMEPTDTEGEALTGGYLIEIDAYANQEPADEWFSSEGGHYIPVTIKSPDPGVEAQYNYIRDKFTDLERRVFSSSFTDDTEGYRAAMDLDSFLKHFIVGELSGNTDTYWSVYMSLDRGDDRFNVGPVWDFDLAFDNDVRIYPVNNHSSFIYSSGGSCAQGMLAFVNRIIKQDTKAKERLKYLWSYARVNQGLDAETFNALVDSYADRLEQSPTLNFKRWPILDTCVHQNPYARGSYAAEVDVLRNYFNARFDKLDQQIGRTPLDGVEPIVRDTSVLAVGNGIKITGSQTYSVINLQGQTIASGRGCADICCPAGIYIVLTPDAATKILVR